MNKLGKRPTLLPGTCVAIFSSIFSQINPVDYPMPGKSIDANNLLCLIKAPRHYFGSQTMGNFVFPIELVINTSQFLSLVLYFITLPSKILDKTDKIFCLPNQFYSI